MPDSSVSQSETSVVLVKKSAVFGGLEVGARYTAPATSVFSGSRHVDAYRALKREYPDENPMEWERSDDERMGAIVPTDTDGGMDGFDGY